MSKRINGQIQVSKNATVLQKKAKAKVIPEAILQTKTADIKRAKTHWIETGKTIEYTATIRRQTELVEQRFEASSDIGLNTEAAINSLTTIISLQPEQIQNIEISSIPTITLTTSKTLSDATVIGTSYGIQYTEGIELKDITNFITDYYSLKYLSARSGVNKRDIAKLLTDLSNLLRNCDIYDIHEVFVATLRFKKAKDKNYWVLVEY